MISSYQHAQAYDYCAKDILPIGMRPQKIVRELIPTFDGQSFSIITESRDSRYPPKSPVWTACIIDNMTCIYTTIIVLTVL